MKAVCNTEAALAHFKKVDPKMAALFKKAISHTAHPITIPKGRASSKYFEAVVASIVSQQISTKAADAVWARLKIGVGKIVPDNLKDRTADELRTYGLSRQKATYIIRSAEIWQTLPLSKFGKMTSGEVITELTKLHGIGVWTAEMFLMFTLARPDIFSMGDWGLLTSIQHNYGINLKTKTAKKKIEKLSELWSPHRTLASLTLWHVKDNKI